MWKNKTLHVSKYVFLKHKIKGGIGLPDIQLFYSVLRICLVQMTFYGWKMKSWKLIWNVLRTTIFWFGSVIIRWRPERSTE